MKKYNDKEIVKRVEQLRCNSAMTNNQFANFCGVDQGNLSKARSGKMGYSELVLMRIAKAMKVSFEWLTTGCGFCGVDGEEAIDELNKDFQGHHNTTVVGNSNNVTTNSFNAPEEDCYKGVLKESIAAGGTISSDLIDLFSGVGGFNDPEAARKLSDIAMRVAKVEEDSKRKDERIRQLEGDKAFLQEMLKKR